MFNSIVDIDRRIEDLQRLKNNYQQPITNIINTNGSRNEFEARYLKENEKVDEILVQNKTAFIDLKNGVLSVKELNGDIASYKIEIPKTPEQLQIEELIRKNNELEMRLNEFTNNNANFEKQKSRDDDSKSCKNKS